MTKSGFSQLISFPFPFDFWRFFLSFLLKMPHIFFLCHHIDLLPSDEDSLDKNRIKRYEKFKPDLVYILNLLYLYFKNWLHCNTSIRISLVIELLIQISVLNILCNKMCTSFLNFWFIKAFDAYSYLFI